MSANSFPKFIILCIFLIHDDSIDVIKVHGMSLIIASKVHEVAGHCYCCRISELSQSLGAYLQHISQFPLLCEGSCFTQDTKGFNQKTTVEADFIASKQVSQQEHANSGHCGRNVVGIKNKECLFWHSFKPRDRKQKSN